MISFILNNVNYIIAICIIIVFYIIIISYLETKTYDDLNGEEPNNTSKNYIYYTKLKHNKNALECFRLGTVYLFHYKDLYNANKYFKESLKKINEGDIKNAVFIIDKLEDYEIYFLNNPDINDLSLHKTKQSLINKKHKVRKENRDGSQIRDIKIIKPTITRTAARTAATNAATNAARTAAINATTNAATNAAKLNFTKQDIIIPQKLILANQSWTSDSQNVHDSSLHNEFKNQLLEVINENQQINNKKENQPENLNDIIDSLTQDPMQPNSSHVTSNDSPQFNKSKLEFSDIVNFYKKYYKDDRNKMEKLSKVLINLEPNNPIHVNNLREQDVISAVWQRAHDPRNAECRENILQSLGECILDCVDKGAVVCLAGRTSRYWQALSNLDFLPEMGILQTKQAIRNEIYEKCASIVHTELRNKELMDYYTSGNNNNPKLTAELNEAIEKINKSIDSLETIYKDKLPNGDLILILNECKAII